MRAWLKFLVTGLVLALPMSARAEAILKFDDPDGPGGTISYDGAGGPAVGTNIRFQSILGLGTPENNGVMLTCAGCLLNFQTGTNSGEGSLGGVPWLFAGGGQITIVGAVPQLGLGEGTTLLSGVFSGVSIEQIGSATFGNFAGQGFDVTDPTLAAFYGLAENFSFSTTAIQFGVVQANGEEGSFTGSIGNADLNNMAAVPPAQVPYPATMLLIGAGLFGARVLRRARE
jgi:PEP-CTERM motif